MTIQKPSKSWQTFWTCITRSVFGVGRHSKSSFSPLFPCPFATDDKVAGHKALEDAAIQGVRRPGGAPILTQFIWQITMMLPVLFARSDADWRSDAAA
jgi:hypothetical protein